MDGLDSIVNTVWIDQPLHEAAWAEYVSRGGVRLSFVDCSTLLIARGLDATIFAFDSDFLLEGHAVLP